ncbi:MAG: hypothetical protein K2Y71_12105 [Xanthobacteraceae bacterium]|nr:hypothetical protein [Xanthobacteraceae bacterium]
MINVTKAFAACAGTIALACAVVQPAKAADMPPQYPQYGGPPPVQEPYVQERYVYQQPPQVYYQPAPPAVVYQEYVPPVVVPRPYYVPPRRVYVDPGYRPYGYRAYGYRPYVAGGYGHHRSHYHHHHHHNHRHWR